MGVVKVIAFLFFLCLMLGFGTCGVFGLFMGLSGLSSGSGNLGLALLGMVGILLSVGIFFVVRAIGRSKPRQ
jgi:hypothetical protein